MDFSLSLEQHELKAAAVDFARRELDRDLPKRDEAGEFSPHAWRACAKFGIQGLPVPAEAAAAKLFTSEAWIASSLDAIQVHGAYGYMKESGIERDLRDAVAGTIYSGTSEIQRVILASMLGL